MRATRALAGIATALLVTFHGWLLAGQFLDGRLARPDLLLRWILAAVLIAALGIIRRQGAEVFSRQLATVWALAFLLHGPALADQYGTALPYATLAESVAPAVLQIAAASTTLALALWLTGPLRRRQVECLARLTDIARGQHPERVFTNRFSPAFAPRPPPAA